ncbi:MAG: ASCH domain-containing protein [Lysobacterales bacterium]
MNSQVANLTDFWSQARTAFPALPDSFTVRQIASQPAVNQAILDAITSGNKTGTVSIPDVYAQTGEVRPAVGDGIILLNAEELPALAVQLTHIDDVPYAKITEKHTALDGPRVRELKAWQDSHKPWFDRQLAPFGLRCEDHTLIAFETFAVRYPALNGA